MPPRKKRPPPEPEPVEEPQPQPEPESSDDEQVEVPFGDNPGETATLLLAAAEELHGDQSSVRTGSGVFIVPKSVADKAKE